MKCFGCTVSNKMFAKLKVSAKDVYIYDLTRSAKELRKFIENGKI